MKMLYSAAFLTEAAREKLLKFCPPEVIKPGQFYKEDPSAHNWYPNVVAHHCTMQFKPTAPPENLGKVVMLRVIATAQDDDCMAAVIVGVDTNNYVPHITVAHSNEKTAKYSNELLRSRQWEPMTEVLELEARIGVFTGKEIVYELPEGI